MAVVRIAAALGLVVAASAAAAASPGEVGLGHASGPAKPALDPDRQICKSQGAIGSRLKRIRVCMSALEWQEPEFQERLGLARKQFNGDPGCNGGNEAACHPERRGGKDTPW